MVSYICSILKKTERVEQMNLVARGGGREVDDATEGVKDSLPVTNEAVGAAPSAGTRGSDAVLCMTAGGESVFRVLITRKNNPATL